MIRKRSKKRAAQERQYAGLRLEFLEDNPACERCGRKATQIHHRKGRTGHLLTDTRYFMATCHECHEWIESHPIQAKDAGYSLSRLATI